MDDISAINSFDFEFREGGYVGWCHCGAQNGWRSTVDLDDDCGGTGVLYCWCGGDLCVCHNHGETPCFGCEECEGDDDDDYCD
jgi:hypothetical protein